MNTSLSNYNALVCGASSGIGAAIAQVLSQAGARLILLARRQEQLEHVRCGLDTPERHQCLGIDLHDLDGLKSKIKAIADAQPIHILINNAGGPPGGALLDASTQDFEKAFRLHVLASQTLAQLLVPSMKKQGYGRIINIISTSVKAPIPNLGVSNTIRGAMGNWSKTLATELGPHHITVNNVLPGFTDTQRLGQLKEATAKRLNKSVEEVDQLWKSKVPLGRLAAPEEVANAVAFLASPEASYINGINLPVDGGRTPSL